MVVNDERRCAVCGGPIAPERTEVQPRVKTCCHACSEEHRRYLRASYRRRKREAAGG